MATAVSLNVFCGNSLLSPSVASFVATAGARIATAVALAGCRSNQLLSSSVASFVATAEAMSLKTTLRRRLSRLRGNDGSAAFEIGIYEPRLVTNFREEENEMSKKI